MTSSTELTTIIRKYLISQSELNGQLVRDAATQYGAYLDVNDHNDVFVSLAPTQTILFFELKTRDSEANMTETNDDLNETITSINSYQLHIITYGDNSNDVCNKLVARLRTERIRNLLLSEGVYLCRISDITRVNEFKNNVVWQRNDFDIDLSCEFTFTQVAVDSAYAELNTITF